MSGSRAKGEPKSSDYGAAARGRLRRAVVATDTASAAADYDNGAAIQATLRPRWRNEGAANRLGARLVRKRDEATRNGVLPD
jgi:hypothetical protein